MSRKSGSAEELVPPSPKAGVWGHPSFLANGVLFAASLTAIALAGCRAHDFPEYDAKYREYAYVTNSGSGTVSVYDVVNTGMASGQGSISVINTENNSVAGSIAVHKMPVAIALDPDGNSGYVVNSGSNTVSVLDLKAHREVTQIGVGESPAAARVSADGKTLVVANRGGNSVTVVDVGTRQVRAVFEGCPGATDVVILPDSSKAFAACGGGHQVMAMQLAHEATTDGRPATMDRLESLLDVGRAPIHLALKPDGGELFVSNSLSNSISEVATSTGDVGGAYLMGAGPVRGIVSADNSLLYVSNQRSQEVAVYGIDDGKRQAAIHVGDGPSALAFSSAGHLLFVVDSRSGDVAVVRTQSKTPAMFTMLPAGRGPNAIAVKAFKVS